MNEIRLFSNDMIDIYLIDHKSRLEIKVVDLKTGKETIEYDNGHYYPFIVDILNEILEKYGE